MESIEDKAIFWGIIGGIVLLIVGVYYINCAETSGNKESLLEELYQEKRIIVEDKTSREGLEEDESVYFIEGEDDTLRYVKVRKSGGLLKTTINTSEIDVTDDEPYLERYDQNLVNNEQRELSAFIADSEE